MPAAGHTGGAVGAYGGQTSPAGKGFEAGGSGSFSDSGD
jgi:hypothetical protein